MPTLLSAAQQHCLPVNGAGPGSAARTELASRRPSNRVLKIDDIPNLSRVCFSLKSINEEFIILMLDS